MQEPDPKTIHMAAAGDVDAFSEIVRTTQPDVWRFLRHLVHDGDLAADLTQDTYVAVYRSLGSFRGDSLFRTWLLRIARNMAIDEHRRTSRRPAASEFDDEALETYSTRMSSTEPNPATAVEITAAMGSLSEPHRSAFVLVEVFGLRYREVAEVLDVPEGTVKSRVFHARSQLVAWFTQDAGSADGTGDQHG